MNNVNLYILIAWLAGAILEYFLIKDACDGSELSFDIEETPHNIKINVGPIVAAILSSIWPIRPIFALIFKFIIKIKSAKLKK